MAHPLHGARQLFSRVFSLHKPKVAHNPALELAQKYTGNYGFLDEQTQKSHALAISPDLDIKIDGSSLPGRVTGITTTTLTFLDHFGYQLIVTCGQNGPESVYDEAEDATYRIVAAEPKTDA